MEDPDHDVYKQEMSIVALLAGLATELTTNANANVVDLSAIDALKIVIKKYGEVCEQRGRQQVRDQSAESDVGQNW